MKHGSSDVVIDLFHSGMVRFSFGFLQALNKKDQMFLEIVVHFPNVVPHVSLIGSAVVMIDGRSKSGKGAIKQPRKRQVYEYRCVG